MGVIVLNFAIKEGVIKKYLYFALDTNLQNLQS